MTKEILRGFRGKARVYRVEVRDGKVQNLWEKQDERDKYCIDTVSFYRDTDVRCNYWFPQDAPIDNCWFILNGAWYARWDEEDDHYNLWGFYHEQYHGAVQKANVIQFTDAQYARVVLGKTFETGENVTYQELMMSAQVYVDRVSKRRFLYGTHQ